MVNEVRDFDFFNTNRSNYNLRKKYLNYLRKFFKKIFRIIFTMILIKKNNF